MDEEMQAMDRRLFLGAGAMTVLGMPGIARAQQSAAEGSAGPGGPPPPARRLSERIAEFIIGFELKEAPPEVIERARVGLIDTVGVMLAGCRQDVSRILGEMVKLEASAPSASVVGQSFKASAQLAALANGVAAHAMDYDLTFVSGQVAAPVLPAILPLAETTGAPPAELMAAYVIGCEIAARVARANFLASSVGGWHPVGTVGVVAAAAACARLLKLPAERISNVIGIAASMASGLSVNFATMTKPLHCGHAARDAVMAALLGSRGFTAQPNTLEGHSGYFENFGRGLDVTYEPFGDLGRRYDLVALGYDIKPYPCGGLAHTSIEAALALRETLLPRLADITRIHCFVTRNAGQRAGVAYPQSVENAKFSLAYVVAYSLVHGAPKIAAFTEAAIRDGRVRELARLVSASVDPELGPGTSRSPARLEITLSDGHSLEARVDDQTGSVRNPMTAEQLADKFRDCAALSVSPQVAGEILAALNELPARASFEDFWPLLRAS